MTDPKTVLVVDDESAVRRLISRVLKDRNFQVLQAENGQKALEIFEGGRKVDLVVLDVMMPEMDGYEVLNKMSEKGFERDVYVIMLTALNTYPSVMKGHNEGAAYYITKPFQNQTLLNIVDYLIGNLTPEEKQKLELRF